MISKLFFISLAIILGYLVFILLPKKIKSTQLLINTAKLVLGGGLVLAFYLLFQFYINDQSPLNLLGGLIRLDSLSTVMFIMVSLIGFIVLQFSESYLQGDPHYTAFIEKLLLTIHFVQLLVLSGNLFFLILLWMATSFSLQRLILFYKDRKGAQQAVRKKNIVARTSDVFLILGSLFLYFEFGTADLESIFIRLKSISSEQLSLSLEISAFFLAIAAIIKSVQIPFHGWILGVMEAPTPVSGLLHAGLLNAGPFLIIRFSYLMELTIVAPILLLIVGGLSALYGTMVFPTQPAVKTSLAYSSIGHMGFSLMICGLGFYSAALLHLTAHSFYKAHSFLSSGSAIDNYRTRMLDGSNVFNINRRQLIAGFFFTSTIFLSIIYWLNQNRTGQFQIVLLSAIILIGISPFIIRSATLKNGLVNIIKSFLILGLVLVAFFTFESVFSTLLTNEIPALSDPNFAVKAVAITIVLLFVTIIYSSQLSRSAGVTSKWQLYTRNGFYIHTIFDRLLTSFTSKNNLLNS